MKTIMEQSPHEAWMDMARWQFMQPFSDNGSGALILASIVWLAITLLALRVCK